MQRDSRRELTVKALAIYTFITKMTTPQIAGHLLRRWAVHAGCDTGTARRFLRGESVRLTTRSCLLRAAEELGIAHLLHVEGPIEKASSE